MRKLICQAAAQSTTMATAISFCCWPLVNHEMLSCLHHNYARYCLPQLSNFKIRSLQEDSCLVACDAVSLGEWLLRLQGQAAWVFLDSLAHQNFRKYLPIDTASHARPPLFKVHVFSVSPAAQWSGRHLWAPVGPDGESCPKHM